MENIRVKVLQADSIENAFIGLRICTDTLDKINQENYEKNIKLLEHSLNDEVPHLSILKHIIYHFLIEGIPRSLLQEVVRHQVGISINVLSTRWALHKIFKDPIFEKVEKNNELNFSEVEKFITKNYFISRELFEMKNDASMAEHYKNWINQRFEEVKEMRYLRLEMGYGNDKIKHLVNESLRTKVYMTISSLALRNILNQRLYKDSWYVFRHLAKLMYLAVPDDHKIIYKDIVNLRGLPEV